MENVIATETIKGGGPTVFMDLKRARNDTAYLTLTTLGKNQDGQAERRSITLFQRQLTPFFGALKNLAKTPDFAAPAESPVEPPAESPVELTDAKPATRAAGK